MRVSAKSDYALRALVHLSVLYRGPQTEPVSIRVLAQSNDIPKRFLEHIMIELRQKGWVQAVPGRGGGFILGLPPAQITMAQVVRHFDDILAPISCVSAINYVACSQESKCRFRRVLMEIRNFTNQRMNDETLASLIAAEPLTQVQIRNEGYMLGDGI